MSDASSQPPHQTPYRFVFSLSEAEISAFRAIVFARLNRKLDGTGYWGTVLLLVFVIGLVVYAAYALGLFGLRSLQPVLFATYAAFFAGAVVNGIGARWQYRRLTRAYYAGSDKEEWEFSFDSTGIVWRSTFAETRTPWRAVRAVEDNGAMVLLWLDSRSRSSFLPARVFGSAATRVAFVAAVAERIAAAREKAA